MREQFLFEQAVLRGGQRDACRGDGHLGFKHVECRRRHVLPVEGDDFAAAGEFGQQRGVSEAAGKLWGDLVGRRAGFLVEEQEIEASG